MLPHAGKKKQAPFSPDRPARTTAAVAELVLPPPENDEALVPRVFPNGPARCPTCGRPDVCFSLRASGVLDALHLARDVISDAIALVEQETMP